MQINKNNCEAFFLDYYEGTLSEGQVAELFAFLKNNPELREVFESFADVSVDAEKTNTPDFSFLKKEPVAPDGYRDEQAQQWMVDAVDGTISAEDKASLEKYLDENPSKRADLAAFEKTVLRADTNETFGDLSFLKKDTAITADNFEYYAVAFIEGTISENEKARLNAFVLQHPAFQEQLDAFREAMFAPEESIVFEGKAALKRSAVTVTEENIAELLVDKIEQQLSPADEQAVDAFVAQHPEYKAELALLAKTKLVADASEVFEAKQDLKRGAVLISESNFEQYAISAAEGILNAEEQKSFDAFVAANPQHKQIVALYAATRVQPDTTIVYEEKAALKRKDKGGIIWWSAGVRYAAAAVLVIVLGLYFWTKFGANENDTPGNHVAEKHEVAPANNDVVAPENNILPENVVNDKVATNDVPANSGVSKIRKGGNRGNEQEIHDQDNDGQSEVAPRDYTPARIVAAVLPGKGNADNGVNFSSAYYGSLDQPSQPVKETPANEYVSPGQYAMRWMKEKLDGPNREPAPQQDPWMAANPQQAQDKNVDGMDLVESIANRVGESAADGNIAMEQRNDGTYLQLWSYEIRVGK